MNDILKLVISLSISGTILILLLFLAKPLYRNRLSRRWQYYIWIVVIARMLLPFSPEDSISGTALRHVDRIIGSKAEATPLSQDYSTENSMTLSSSHSMTLSSSHSQTESTTPSSDSDAAKWYTAVRRPDITLIYDLLLPLYFGIALLLLLKKAVIYNRFVHFVKAGMTRITDTQILNLLSEACGQVGLRTPVTLYTNSAVTSPMTIGLFHPFLIMPDTKMNPEELRCILLHELTHIKRLDILYKWWVQFTICLHWFNPLVYLMGKEINNSCELSCDEVIVQNTDTATRKIYGDTLLHSLAYAGRQKDNFASVHLSRNAELIKERLGAIMKYRKSSTAVTIITTIITILICAGSYATGAYAAQSPSTEEESQNIWTTMAARRGETYTYTQTGYYQYPYIFSLGWNLNETGQKAYPDKVLVTLSDHTSMNVYFTGNYGEYAKENDVLPALTQLIERLKAKYADSFIPLESPIVVDMEYVGDREVADLAEEYYKDGRLTDFTAVFPVLDNKTQLSYCDQMYRDSEIAFFSSCLRQMTPEFVSACAEKTYITDNSFFFSSIVPYLTEKEIDEYLTRAGKDKKANFRYCLQKEKDLISAMDTLKAALKKELESLNPASTQKEALKKETEASNQLEEKVKSLQEEISRLEAPEAALTELLEQANIDAAFLQELKQSNQLETLKSFLQKELDRLNHDVN